MAGRRMLSDNICTSKKIAKISFGAECLWYRLLTKVDDNGNFHGDVATIRGHCMPLLDVALTQIEEWLQELANVRGNGEPTGLIAFYDFSGERYIHFVGFELFQTFRPDRALVVRFPKHPVQMADFEEVADVIPMSRQVAPVCHTEEKLREVKIREVKLSKPHPLETQLTTKCVETFGRADKAAWFRTDLKRLTKTYSEEEILKAFEFWIQAAPKAYARPISVFLQAVPGLLASGTAEIEVPSEDLQKLFDEIALASDNDVVFAPHQKPFVAQLLKEFTHQELMAAFRDFYSRVDDFDRKFAAKNFCEKGAQFARTIRTSVEQAKQKAEFIERETARMRAEAEVQLANLAAKHAAEEAAENAAFEELTAEFAKEAGMTSGTVKGEVVR